jgi:hypothetical protein
MTSRDPSWMCDRYDLWPQKQPLLEMGPIPWSFTAAYVRFGFRRPVAMRTGYKVVYKAFPLDARDRGLAWYVNGEVMIGVPANYKARAPPSADGFPADAMDPGSRHRRRHASLI